jgi:ribonucleoside-diphosphate reductase alpha chain
MDRTYAHVVEDENRPETWEEIATRVVRNVMKAVSVDMRQRLAQELCRLITERKFIPGGRYLYASGNQYHQVNNCLLLNVHDSREGWSELLYKASMALMSGAGIGVSYSDIRPDGAPIRKTGGVATGPIALMQILNECGRGIIQGGNRRSAIWAGLRWSHPDVHRFIRIKNWPAEIHALKAKDYSFPAILDCTNISVQLDDVFFEAYQDDEHPQHSLAHSVYWAVIEQMLKTGEPGFTVDTGKNNGEVLRNACGELASRDTDDVCNLGSINLSRIENLEEFKSVMDFGIAFLLAGTVYSDVPYSEVDKVRSKNRRLGFDGHSRMVTSSW